MSPLSYLLLITNIHVQITWSASWTSCSGFPCKWTVDDYELDLTPFQFMGINLTTSDNNGNAFYFTPCNNLLPSTSSGNNLFQYMAVVVNNQQETRNLARYSKNVNPTIKFDADAQPIWNFQYNENLTVEYICDYDLMSSFMEFKQVLEVFPDQFLFQISSYYVCDNVTVNDELNKNQCIWSDETSSNVLDLRGLYGVSISKSPYTLHVCQNSYYSDPTWSAAGGFCYYGSNCCAMYGCPGCSASYAYGFFDPLVQPLFDSSNNTWTFKYKSSPSTELSQLTVRWVCDPKTPPINIISISRAEIEIGSVYACPQQLRCIFFDENNENNVLDLTQLYGDMIKYVNEDTTYSFEYTVCNNDIVCNGSVSTMAMRWNIHETKCDPWLARWDGFDGYNLSYDVGLKQWQFTYFNGEICQNQINTQFNIYWKCNEAVSKWNVTNVESINECEYAMYIDSSVAC